MAVMITCAVLIVITLAAYISVTQRMLRPRCEEPMLPILKAHSVRERVDFGEYDRKGAEYRRRREREMLGKSKPIRKAVGLFSDVAAQEAVAI